MNKKFRKYLEICKQYAENRVNENLISLRQFNMRYYRYMLHALCSISGVIQTATNVHHLHYLKDIK